jgi:hypothetical protein
MVIWRRKSGAYEILVDTRHAIVGGNIGLPEHHIRKHGQPISALNADGMRRLTLWNASLLSANTQRDAMGGVAGSPVEVGTPSPGSSSSMSMPLAHGTLLRNVVRQYWPLSQIGRA